MEEELDDKIPLRRPKLTSSMLPPLLLFVVPVDTASCDNDDTEELPASHDKARPIFLAQCRRKVSLRVGNDHKE